MRRKSLQFICGCGILVAELGLFLNDLGRQLESSALSHLERDVRVVKAPA